MSRPAHHLNVSNVSGIAILKMLNTEWAFIALSLVMVHLFQNKICKLAWQLFMKHLLFSPFFFFLINASMLISNIQARVSKHKINSAINATSISFYQLAKPEQPAVASRYGPHSVVRFSL